MQQNYKHHPTTQMQQQCVRGCLVGDDEAGGQSLVRHAHLRAFGVGVVVALLVRWLPVRVPLRKLVPCVCVSVCVFRGVCVLRNQKNSG